MNISKEILNTIDGLGERFGANLCEGFVNYKLTQYWIGFGVLVILTAIAIWCLVDVGASYRVVRRRMNSKEWEQEKNNNLIGDIFWSKHRNWKYCNYTDHFRVEYLLHKVRGGEVWLTTIGLGKLVAGGAFSISCGIGLIVLLVQIIQCYVTPEIFVVDYIVNHIG